MPFFDAVCANDLVCARDIAVHSRHTWNPELEYEDDFLFVHFLMQLFFLDATADDCRKTLARHWEVAQQPEDPQYRMSLALLEGDAAEFKSALGHYLLAEKATYAELEKSSQLEEEVAATEPFLSVHGLALVRLAETKGIRVPARLKGLSAFARLARKAPTAIYAPATWRRILQGPRC